MNLRSIRLSLLVYLSLLLFGALAAVGALVYRTTREALREKEDSTRDLLLAQNEGRARAARDEWDDRLHRRAQTLASLAQSQFGNHRFHELSPLGLLTAGLNPNAQLLVPLWLAESYDGRLSSRLRRVTTIRIQFAEEVLAREADGQTLEFFQVYNEQGGPLQRSSNLPRETLTLDPEVRDSLGLFESVADDVDLGQGTLARRVTLKVPVTRFRFHYEPYTPRPPRRNGSSRSEPRPPEPRPPEPRREPTRPPEPPPVVDRISPAIFIQCAADTRALQEQLAGFEQERQAEVASLEAESRATLREVEKRLFWTGMATFAAAFVGGFWLVRAGLAPLNRLSDGVRHVSEKDFRLLVDPATMPRELLPIIEHLTQTLASLQRAFAREKQAAADISHELRTPVAALLATADYALRKPRTADEYRELFRECHSSGRQMTQLIERLLTLARLDAGVDPLRKEETDVAGLAEQCANLVRPLAEARGLKLNVATPKRVLLRSDPDKLREVLTNLLHNAVEYNREGGAIDLTVERHNGSVRVAVRDTGVGISASAREHIFERFYRADPSRQADGLHAGLGLAISKSYVELLGGTIAVESAEGEGSCFRIELPLH